MKRPQKVRAWLETLFQSSPDAHLLITAEGRVKFANPAALVVFAAEEEQLAGSLVDQWIPGFDPTGSAPAGGAEAEAVSAMGDHFPIEYSVTSAGDEKEHLWVVVRDIQRRKGLEGSLLLHTRELEQALAARIRELDELRERSTTAYEAAPILDFALDSEGNIASANRKACLSLGTTAERLIGLSLGDLATPEARPELETQLAALRDGGTAPFETVLRGAQGTGINVAFHPARSTSGGRSHLRLLGQDVTARREAERLVDQSLGLAEAQRARMERILRGIGDPVVVTDPDGQVRLMNDAAEQVFGVNQHLAFGRDLFSEQHDAAFVEQWHAFLTGGDDVLHAELRRDGAQSRSYIITLSRVRTDEGRLAAYAAILRDVTRERATERLKREFLANLTHELRTPLASIRALATSILNDGHVTAGSDRRFLGIIQNDAVRLQARLEDILTLTRLEAGRENLQYRLANVVRLMNEARARWTANAIERSIRIEVEAQGDGEGVFDPDRIRRVIERLVTNAMRFTPEGGVVRMTMTRTERGMECSVSDTGRGMDPEKLHRVLDPFSGAAVPGMPESPSLGLHIVSRLVELHGGELTAESCPGEGTTFRFVIPASPASAPKAEPRKPDPLVDDDDEIPDALADDPLIDDPDPVS